MHRKTFRRAQKWPNSGSSFGKHFCTKQAHTLHELVLALHGLTFHTLWLEGFLGWFSVPRLWVGAWGECGCWRHWPASPQSPVTDPAAAKPSSQQSQVPPVHHCGVYSHFTSSMHSGHYYSVYYRSMRYLRGTFRREQTGAIKVKFCLQKPCLVLPVLREEALLPEEK